MKLGLNLEISVSFVIKVLQRFPHDTLQKAYSPRPIPLKNVFTYVRVDNNRILKNWGVDLSRPFLSIYVDAVKTQLRVTQLNITKTARFYRLA